MYFLYIFFMISAFGVLCVLLFPYIQMCVSFFVFGEFVFLLAPLWTFGQLNEHSNTSCRHHLLFACPWFPMKSLCPCWSSSILSCNAAPGRARWFPSLQPGGDGGKFWELHCLGFLPNWKPSKIHSFLGGGFKHLLFSPLFGEMIQFDKYFSDGLKPPTSYWISWLPGWRCHFSER